MYSMVEPREVPVISKGYMERPWDEEARLVDDSYFIIKALYMVNGVKYFYAKHIRGIMETLEVYHHIRPISSKYAIHKRIKEAVGNMFAYTNELDRRNGYY